VDVYSTQHEQIDDTAIEVSRAADCNHTTKWISRLGRSPNTPTYMVGQIL